VLEDAVTEDELVVRVPDSELDFDDELVYRRRGELFSGIGYAESAGPEAGLSEVSYRDGLQDGPARDWYPSGRLKGESYFWENVLHGPSRSYRIDGSLASDALYEYGILVSVQKFDHGGAMEDSWVISPTDSTHALLEKYRRERGWPLQKD
jgi:hypothetical protein